jgi:hypothetical protein
MRFSGLIFLAHWQSARWNTARPADPTKGAVETVAGLFPPQPMIPSAKTPSSKIRSIFAHPSWEFQIWELRILN